MQTISQLIEGVLVVVGVSWRRLGMEEVIEMHPRPIAVATAVQSGFNVYSGRSQERIICPQKRPNVREIYRFQRVTAP